MINQSINLSRLFYFFNMFFSIYRPLGSLTKKTNTHSTKKSNTHNLTFIVIATHTPRDHTQTKIVCVISEKSEK